MLATTCEIIWFRQIWWEGIHFIESNLELMQFAERNEMYVWLPESGRTKSIKPADWMPLLITSESKLETSNLRRLTWEF